ncbi:Uncharacterised protein [Chlamydia trachomatis]|nr:Uncharacterised protein [Chlamydia trachomatis]
MKAIFKNKNITIPVETVAYTGLAQLNNPAILVVVTADKAAGVEAIAPAARILAVDSLVTTPDYDKLVATI